MHRLGQTIFGDMGVVRVYLSTYPLRRADMTITQTHVGNFTPGQTGATYTITAQNGGSVDSQGRVTVTDLLPYGLAARALAGEGWSCALDTLTCTRSDSLAPGAAYPAITLAVDVILFDAPSTVTNVAIVRGGADTNPGNNRVSQTLLQSFPPRRCRH